MINDVAFVAVCHVLIRLRKRWGRKGKDEANSKNCIRLSQMLNDVCFFFKFCFDF